MPHIIPVIDKDVHIADVSCGCEPEILFTKNNAVLILHKVIETDQMAFEVVPDDHYDENTVKKEPSY
jgi:hypothetical protein